MTPGSAVSVIRSAIFSSLATLATPSGMPMPRLTTLLASSSSAARRAMIFRSFSSIARHRSGARPNLAAERRVVLHRKCLPVVLRPRHDDAIDEDAGDLDLPRIERAALGDPLHLRDDEAAGVARRHRDRQHLERERLLLHRDVAVGIGGRSADDADVDRECPIEEKLLALDLDQPDQILLGAFVDLAAAVARIDERSEPDAREVSGPPRRDVAEQVRDDALRKVVGLDLVGDRETLQLGHQSPVSADHPPHQPVVAEVIEPALLAVSLPGRIDQREIPRLAARLDDSAASSATAISSAKPMPTKPPVAMVSPSRIRRTASSALTIFPLSAVCSDASSIGWRT